MNKDFVKFAESLGFKQINVVDSIKPFKLKSF